MAPATAVDTVPQPEHTAAALGVAPAPGSWKHRTVPFAVEKSKRPEIQSSQTNPLSRAAEPRASGPVHFSTGVAGARLIA